MVRLLDLAYNLRLSSDDMNTLLCSQLQVFAIYNALYEVVHHFSCVVSMSMTLTLVWGYVGPQIDGLLRSSGNARLS